MYFFQLKIPLLISAVIVTAVSQLAIAGNSGAAIKFFPAPGTEATLIARGHDVELALSGRRGGSTETITVETEKPLKIKIEDYDFDGYNDFSISHVDDGMGVNIIYEVYIYSVQKNKFFPLKPFCGDEFINLTINKTTRTLTNSYILNNVYATCNRIF